MSIRAVKKILKPQPTLEGAGVKLQRGFGFGDPKEFDPFLLFDDFRNDNPEEYLAGFPWHPASRHRDHHLRARRRTSITATASATAAPCRAATSSG